VNKLFFSRHSAFPIVVVLIKKEKKRKKKPKRNQNSGLLAPPYGD
jgi:hypothetical protein